MILPVSPVLPTNPAGIARRHNMIQHYQNLRGQARDLSDPARRSGPSRYEAQERVTALCKEADRLSEQIYWEDAGRIAGISAANGWGVGAKMSELLRRAG